MGTIADKLNYTQTSVNSIRNAIKQKNDAYVIDSPLSDAAQAILDISGGGSGGGYNGQLLVHYSHYVIPNQTVQSKIGTAVTSILDEFNISEISEMKDKTKSIFTIKKPGTYRASIVAQRTAAASTVNLYKGNNQVIANTTTTMSSADPNYEFTLTDADINGVDNVLTTNGLAGNTSNPVGAIFILYKLDGYPDSRFVKFAKSVGVPAVATFDFDVKAVLIGRTSASMDRFNPYRVSAIEWMAYKADDGSTHSVVAGSYYELTEEPTTSGIYINGNTVTAKQSTSQNSLFICAFNYVPDEIKNAIDG